MVILASEADGSLKVQVIDHGIGLGPRFDSPGMGLGLPLMSRLAESFEAQSSAGSGTEIRMNFKLRQPDVAEPGHRTAEPADVAGLVAQYA